MKKLIFSVFLLASFGAQAQSGTINCYSSPKGVGKPAYTILPIDSNRATLIHPGEATLTREEFEEQNENGDITNFGSCIGTSEGYSVGFCGAENNVNTSFVTVNARRPNLGTQRIVYCENGISQYVFGIPSGDGHSRGQGPKY